VGGVDFRQPVVVVGGGYFERARGKVKVVFVKYFTKSTTGENASGNGSAREVQLRFSRGIIEKWLTIAPPFL
jgi:hypothetical protein